MPKRIVRLRHRITRALELPEEAVEGASRVQLLGRAHMLIENHGGVYEYRADCVRVHTRDTLLRVTGRELVLRELSRDRLYIGGEITGFFFE